MTRFPLILLSACMMLMTGNVEAAATCTSKASGSWASAATWVCTGTPIVTIPTTTDTAIIASPHTVSLVGSVPVTNLTVNAGGTLNAAGFTLTVSGNITNNGTITNTAGTGNINSTGNAAVFSGTGSFSNVRIYTSGATPSVAAGSTLNFSGSSRFYAGRTSGGNTVAGSVLTINGRINSTVTSATTTFLRLYANSTAIGATGVISAATSATTFNVSTATLTNNGSVTLQIITRNATTNAWTQGANSSLTLSAVSTVGTLYASANGNTVTYIAPAKPITPSGNTYYNLSGSGVVCPHAFTVLGGDPCAVSGVVSVTMNPGSCVNTTGIGTVAWAPTPTTNANLSDNLYATATVNGTTNYLKCTGYNFAIPASATILGITANVERKSSSTSRTTDGAMRLVKAGLIGTVDRKTTTVYSTTDVVEAHGSSADLWGTAWTPANINAATFGAAFAATSTKSRTISVDHLPITVSYSAPTGPHHIQIEHDGAGLTCSAEQLTVRACADAACASNFTGAGVSGNVTWAGSPGGTLPFVIAAGGSGQVTLSLAVTSAQTVTLGTSAITPAPTAASGCTNLSTGVATCSLTFAASSQCRDAVEVGAAAATPIYTKLVGTAFSLDVLSVGGANYTGTVKVDLVDAATGSCATYTQLNTQNVAFSNTNKKTVSFTYANAVKTAKIRITGAAASSCSTDKFAIRPTSIAVTSTANADPTGANANATPGLVAGSDFTLTATAIAGYSGTPTVNAAQVAAHGGSMVDGAVGGSFPAANPATGVATAATFTYSEVGYFRFNAQGVTDATFTAIDSAAGDCIKDGVNDYSNTLVGTTKKYGCYFGNAAATPYFGRFVPDHFAVVRDDFAHRTDWCDADGSLVSDGVTPCAAPTFTYMGERMDAQFTLQAENLGNELTQNYDGAYAKLNPLAAGNTLQFGAVDAAANTNLTARLDTSLVAASGTGSFGGGSAAMAVPLAITRSGAPDGPYAELDVGIAPTDSDGVTTVLDLDTTGDGTDDRTQVNTNNAGVRYGRIRLTNAHGSELLPLTLAATVQYWDGAAYITNLDDNAAVMTFTLGSYLSNLNAGETTLTAPVILLGLGQLRLSAPGAGNNGSVNVSVSAPVYLPGNTARATFGVYKGGNEFICLRENY